MIFPAPTSPTLYRFRFVPATTAADHDTFEMMERVENLAPDDVATLAPRAPSPTDATTANLEVIVVPSSARGDLALRESLDAWLVAPDLSAPLSVQQGDVQLAWQSGRAVLAFSAPLAPAAIEAIADFTAAESELRRLEADTVAAWASTEADTRLTFAVKPQDKALLAGVGERVQAVLLRRMKFARTEPRLLESPAHLAATARALGDRLREAARCASRAEALDAQIESQETVYELASQRIGEARHARESFALEILIVVLLAAEVILMIWEVSLNYR